MCRLLPSGTVNLYTQKNRFTTGACDRGLWRHSPSIWPLALTNFSHKSHYIEPHVMRDARRHHGTNTTFSSGSLRWTVPPLSTCSGNSTQNAHFIPFLFRHNTSSQIVIGALPSPNATAHSQWCGLGWWHWLSGVLVFVCKYIINKSIAGLF